MFHIAMKFDPIHHHRHSIRASGYDYSEPGAYFLTICAHQKKCLFGEIRNGVMGLNEAGCMISRWWSELPNKFPTVQTAESVVMPNHFHGIIVITVGATLCGRPTPRGRPNPLQYANGRPHWGAPTLGNIVDWFKTMTTNEYIRGIKKHNWTKFTGRFWQRNYYDHIIRNDADLLRCRQYVLDNPPKWELDENHPDRPVHPLPSHVSSHP